MSDDTSSLKRSLNRAGRELVRHLPPSAADAARQAAMTASRVRLLAARAGNAPSVDVGTKHAIVHVGMPKTGTTFLQKWFMENDAALRERGIASPRSALPGMDFRIGQIELGFCMCERADVLMPHQVNRSHWNIHSRQDQARFVETYTAHYRKLLSDMEAGTVVLSNEDLTLLGRDYGAAPGLHAWLTEMFASVRYIIYVRRQEDLLLSRYSQNIKGGSTPEIKRMISRYGLIDFNAAIAPWVEVAGRGNVLVRLFEPSEFEGGTLISDFGAATGLDLSGLPSPPRVNEALGPAALEVLRRINELEPIFIGNPPRRNPMNRDLSAHLERLHDPEDRLTLGPKMIDWIRDLNADVNETFRATYFPDRDVLFPKRPDTPWKIEPTVDEVIDLAAKLVRAYRLGELPVMTDSERQNYKRDTTLAPVPEHHAASGPAAGSLQDPIREEN